MPTMIWRANEAEYRAGPADGKGFQLPRLEAFPVDTALFAGVLKSKFSMAGKLDGERMYPLFLDAGKMDIAVNTKLQL